MRRTVLGCVAVTALGAIAASPAMAFRGGGMGGMHMGGMGGMHMGGMHMGGMHMGGMHMGAPAFHGGMFAGRSVFVPGGNRFVRGPFARHVFFNRFNRFGFRHHRFRSFAFGAPFVYAAYDYGCWRPVWTGYGRRWINVCYDYGY
jgi:hypothetical protein